MFTCGAGAAVVAGFAIGQAGLALGVWETREYCGVDWWMVEAWVAFGACEAILVSSICESFALNTVCPSSISAWRAGVAIEIMKHFALSTYPGGFAYLAVGNNVTFHTLAIPVDKKPILAFSALGLIVDSADVALDTIVLD